MKILTLVGVERVLNEPLQQLDEKQLIRAYRRFLRMVFLILSPDEKSMNKKKTSETSKVLTQRQQLYNSGLITLDDCWNEEIEPMIEIGGNFSANSAYNAFIPDGIAKVGADSSHGRSSKLIKCVKFPGEIAC
ncbi:hypothetical protein C5167_050200 [Papaver somniferum]|uniref:Uncharacterized protein n=1 Tax=Papaver somniferum TaxID=3469 RepID=A0A4Y7KQQ6_PAPSO|nr:hypothetical protein C5167_050200 [Papaver somniferum]